MEGWIHTFIHSFIHSHVLIYACRQLYEEEKNKVLKKRSLKGSFLVLGTSEVPDNPLLFLCFENLMGGSLYKISKIEKFRLKGIFLKSGYLGIIYL